MYRRMVTTKAAAIGLIGLVGLAVTEIDLAWFEKFGIAALTIVILWVLLRQANENYKESVKTLNAVQERSRKDLLEVVARNTEMMARNAESTADLTKAVTMLAASIARRNSEEDEEG